MSIVAEVDLLLEGVLAGGGGLLLLGKICSCWRGSVGAEMHLLLLGRISLLKGSVGIFVCEVYGCCPLNHLLVSIVAEVDLLFLGGQLLLAGSFVAGRVLILGWGTGGSVVAGVI